MHGIAFWCSILINFACGGLEWTFHLVFSFGKFVAAPLAGEPDGTRLGPLGKGVEVYIKVCIFAVLDGILFPGILERKDTNITVTCCIPLSWELTSPGDVSECMVSWQEILADRNCCVFPSILLVAKLSGLTKFLGVLVGFSSANLLGMSFLCCNSKMVSRISHTKKISSVWTRDAWYINQSRIFPVQNFCKDNNPNFVTQFSTMHCVDCIDSVPLQKTTVWH